MKKFLAIVACLLPLAVWAQFDEQFYHPTREWVENALPPHEDVWVVSDADSTHAIWCAPARDDIRAVVLFNHGNAGNLSYCEGVIAPLVEAGYAVMAWDYPGFGRSTGKPTHVGIAAAGERVFEAMTARAKKHKVVVMGFSIGCQIAARLARAHSERVTALVMDAGMRSFTEMALASVPAEMHELIRTHVTSPYSAIEDVQHLGGMGVLIAHSPDDTVAPIGHSRALYDAAAEPKSFLEHPGGHISAIVGAKDEALAALAKLTE